MTTSEKVNENVLIYIGTSSVKQYYFMSQTVKMTIIDSISDFLLFPFFECLFQTNYIKYILMRCYMSSLNPFFPMSSFKK